MTLIEELWQLLRTSPSGSGQIRVDAEHPLDLYADFQAPDRPGLVAICGAKPPKVRAMHALSIDEGHRSDGRWSFRIALVATPLLPVFAALCRDIVNCSRLGVAEAGLGTMIVQRLIHWRSLLERDGSGLGEAALEGLIGELLILRDQLLPELGSTGAVAAWRGPSGAPQDFILPDGRRLEVKLTGEYGSEIQINGLDQLDPNSDALTLIVVRAQSATADAPNAITAPMLVGDVKHLLGDEPEAVRLFETALAGIGWHEHPSHDAFALRVMRLETHEVEGAFPRLTRATVPLGVVNADYRIMLPARPPSASQVSA